jgi:hypothetical protein
MILRPSGIPGGDNVTTATAATPSVGSISLGFRYAYVILLWIFLAGVVLQFFLAGYAAFNGTNWDAHAGMGHPVSYLTLLLLIFAFAGRMPRPLPRLTALLVLLLILQIALAIIGENTPIVGAFHPINALIVAGFAAYLARRSRLYVPPPIGRQAKQPATP